MRHSSLLAQPASWQYPPMQTCKLLAVESLQVASFEQDTLHFPAAQIEKMLPVDAMHSRSVPHSDITHRLPMQRCCIGQSRSVAHATVHFSSTQLHNLPEQITRPMQ
jgi:hypothetical protein